MPQKISTKRQDSSFYLSDEKSSTAMPFKKKNNYNFGNTKLATKGSNLMDLKQRRREQRQVMMMSESTWYEEHLKEEKIDKTTEKTFNKIELPPSPTMIRHKFVQPSDIEISSNLISVKKNCSIM